MKPVLLSTLLLMLSLNASAARLVECLGEVATPDTFTTSPNGTLVRNFHKVTITETSRKVLRGNYSVGPKSLMNYSSIDVMQVSNNVFSQVRPAQSVQTFMLSISNEPVAVELDAVIVSGKPFKSARISGMKAKYAVDDLYLTDGKVHHIEADLICGSPLKYKEIRH